MSLDAETTLHLRRVLGHIVEAEAAAPQNQGVIKAREALAVLLQLEGASAAAMILHDTETELEGIVRRAVGPNSGAYKQLYVAIRQVEKARLARTLEKAFATSEDGLIAFLEKATCSFFDEAGVSLLKRGIAELLSRHHGFEKEA